jgi:hypothetical protein
MRYGEEGGVTRRMREDGISTRALGEEGAGHVTK